MLSADDEILIDKFFDGEITTEELLLFKTRMREDAEFKQAVELQQAAITGIGLFGKQALKAELTDIHNEVKGGLKKYKPGKDGGSIIITLIKWLIALGIIAACGWYALQHYGEGGFNFSKHKLQELKRSIIEEEESNKGFAPANTDTIYHTIKTHTTIKRDTVIYGEENMKKYLEENSIEQTRNSSKQVIIKRDTITRMQ